MGFFDSFFSPSQKNSTSTGYTTSYSSPNPNYQGYTAAVLNPRSEISDRADELTRGLAMGGSPALQGANQYNADVTSGKYLGGNPYNDQMFANASRGVADRFRYATAPQIQGQSSLAGRFGSGAQARSESMARNDLGDTLNRLAGDIYGADYTRERQSMDNAASRAPGLNAADYYGANQLAKQGAVRDAYFDQAATRQYQQWRDNQTLPYMYGATSYGNQSQTTPYYGSSPFQTILGAGSQIGSMFL